MAAMRLSVFCVSFSGVVQTGLGYVIVSLMKIELVILLYLYSCFIHLSLIGCVLIWFPHYKNVPFP